MFWPKQTKQKPRNKMDLTDIKGIGRVRSRKLYRQGIKKPSEIKETPYPALAELLGPKTAKKIKERLGQEVEQVIEGEERQAPGQRTINQY